VQDSSRAAATDDLEVEQRLRGRTEPGATDHLRPLINLEQVRWSKPPLVLPTRGDCESEGSAPEYGAEVSTRPEYPAAVMELPADGCQITRDRQEFRIHHGDKLDLVRHTLTTGHNGLIAGQLDPLAQGSGCRRVVGVTISEAMFLMAPDSPPSPFPAGLRTTTWPPFYQRGSAAPALWRSSSAPLPAPAPRTPTCN